MKKLVWAIAAIFCAQVAFQLIMLAERSDADYATLRTSLHQPVDPYTTPAVSDEDLVVSDDTYLRDGDYEDVAEWTGSNPHFGKYRSTANSVRTSSVRHRRRESLGNGVRFDPIVITYKTYNAPAEVAAFERDSKVQAPAPIGQPKEDLRTVKEDRPPAKEDSRPMIAKVVTKPFDWLKIVASKLH